MLPVLLSNHVVLLGAMSTSAQAHALACAQLCPHALQITPELVQCLHAEGFRVRAWGVAHDALMRQVVEAGADGMTVHFPDRLLADMAGHANLSA